MKNLIVLGVLSLLSISCAMSTHTGNPDNGDGSTEIFKPNTEEGRVQLIASGADLDFFFEHRACVGMLGIWDGNAPIGSKIRLIEVEPFVWTAGNQSTLIREIDRSIGINWNSDRLYLSLMTSLECSEMDSAVEYTDADGTVIASQGTTTPLIRFQRARSVLGTSQVVFDFAYYAGLLFEEEDEGTTTETVVEIMGGRGRR